MIEIYERKIQLERERTLIHVNGEFKIKFSRSLSTLALITNHRSVRWETTEARKGEKTLVWEE